MLDWPQSLLAIAFTLKHARALEYVQTVLVLLIYHNRDMADDDINIYFNHVRVRFEDHACCGATASLVCSAISTQINRILFVEDIEFQAQHGNSEQQECNVLFS